MTMAACQLRRRSINLPTGNTVLGDHHDRHLLTDLDHRCDQPVAASAATIAHASEVAAAVPVTFNGAWLAKGKLAAHDAAKVRATIYLRSADIVFTLNSLPVILGAPNAGAESGEWIELVAAFPDVPLAACLRQLTEEKMRFDATLALALAVVHEGRVRHVLRPTDARQGQADSLPRDQTTTASSDAPSMLSPNSTTIRSVSLTSVASGRS